MAFQNTLHCPRPKPSQPLSKTNGILNRSRRLALDEAESERHGEARDVGAREDEAGDGSAVRAVVQQVGPVARGLVQRGGGDLRFALNFRYLGRFQPDLDF